MIGCSVAGMDSDEGIHVVLDVVGEDQVLFRLFIISWFLAIGQELRVTGGMHVKLDIQSRQEFFQSFF